MTMGTYPMGENVGKMLDLRGSVHLVRLGARVLPLNGREPSSHHVNEVLSHFEVRISGDKCIKSVFPEN